MSEINLALAIGALFLLPGAALVHLGPWVKDPPLQRLSLSVGMSVAFWPVLFYGIRLFPNLAFTPLGFWIVLGLFVGLFIWRVSIASWRLSIGEWVMLIVLLGAFVTRFYIIADLPYPAWTDSLHHTLLTEITGKTGRLPFTLDPYMPEINLDQYHLGLYALSGSAQMLSGAPAHTALLWVAQTINACSGLGVYFVLDRWVGRHGALVGAMMVSFWSFQPAWYVNWGRFTQLAGNFVLPFAWVVVVETLRIRKVSRLMIWPVIGSSILQAGLFEMHFRVSGLYIPLIVLSAWVLIENLKSYNWKIWLALLLGVFVMALPSAVPSVAFYLNRTLIVSPNISAVQDFSYRAYYEVDFFDALFAIGLRAWLFFLTFMSVLWIFWQRNRLGLLMILWVAAIILIGNAYVLRIPVLNLTNLGAVIIMLYLPASILVGVATELIVNVSGRWRPAFVLAGSFFSLMLSIYTGAARATEVEIYRYFVASADVKAMQWIKDHTPINALFGINTYMWLPRAPHGTDAGYWIPYFTGRHTTAGVMINNLGSPEYVDKIVERSRAIENLENNPDAVNELSRLGIDYLYIGALGDYASPGLNANQLLNNPGLDVVYHADGVWIFKVIP